jgi:hypothetical protein
MSETPLTAFRPGFGCASLVVLPGLVLLAVAWFGVPGMDWNGGNILFRSDLVHTTGKVVELQYSPGASPSDSPAYPIVQFAVGDRTATFQGIGTHPPGGAVFESRFFKVGEEVPVAYPKNEPEKAYINTFGQSAGIPTMLALFALTFLAIGWWLVSVARRRP